MRAIVTELLMGPGLCSSIVVQTKPTKSVDEIAAELGCRRSKAWTRGLVTLHSALSTELPRRAAYLVHRGVRILLQRVADTGKAEDANGRITQYAIYLLLIQYVRLDTKLVVDCVGSRSGFGVTSFAAKEPDDVMPAFAHLDEYDAPQDADMVVVRKVLVREYPEQANLLR